MKWQNVKQCLFFVLVLFALYVFCFLTLFATEKAGVLISWKFHISYDIYCAYKSRSTMPKQKLNIKKNSQNSLRPTLLYNINNKRRIQIKTLQWSGIHTCTYKYKITDIYIANWFSRGAYTYNNIQSLLVPKILVRTC